MEWLAGTGLIVSVWAYLFFNTPAENTNDYARHFVLFLPIYILLTFGVSLMTFLSNFKS